MYTSGDDQFPRLKSKAAETKYLAAALLYAFTTLMSPDDEQHKWIKLLLSLAVRMETLLEENKDLYRLPAPVAAEWKEVCQGYVQVTTQLGQYYHRKKIMLFHFTIKMHYVLHIALLGQRINPRLGWCYCGERMMQVVKLIVQKSHLGSPAPLVVNKVMGKYGRGLSLKFLGDNWRR